LNHEVTKYTKKTKKQKGLGGGKKINAERRRIEERAEKTVSLRKTWTTEPPPGLTHSKTMNGGGDWKA